jgi:hypothetical protein
MGSTEITRRQFMGRSAAVVAAGLATVAALDPSVVDAAAKRPPSIGQVSSAKLWGLRRGRVGARLMYDGEATKILNLGGFGHLAGTPLPNRPGNAVLPGHRTSHGGPLRKLHTLVPGDTITVATTDGVTKTYRMSEPSIIVGAKDRAAVVNWGDPTKSSITLVGCSKKNKLPTDVRYRLIARFVEVTPQ